MQRHGVPHNGAEPAKHQERLNGSGDYSERVPLPSVVNVGTANVDVLSSARFMDRQRIDKSLLAIPEVKRLRDKDHLRFVATHPCLVCGRQPTEAHHLKFSQPSALGRKVSDAFTVPLCALHHRDLHTTGNELAWWERKQIDPMVTAKMLWDESHGRAAPQPQNSHQPDVTGESG